MQRSLGAWRYGLAARVYTILFFAKLKISIMLKGIFWDNDGVLADTEKLFYQVNRRILAEHDFELDAERYVDWFLESNTGAWHILAKRGYTEEMIGALRIERNFRYAQAIRDGKNLQRDDIASVVVGLRSRARMAIVTASHEQHLQLIYHATGFLGNFDAIVARETVPTSKPAPDCYKEALRQLDIDPRQCIVVEDSPRGLAAAVAAGIQCVVLRSAFLQNYRFTGALEVVSCLVPSDHKRV